MRPIKQFIWKILNFTPAGPLLQLYLRSELKNNGWFRSFRSKRSVDASGQPIPWYTYSFLQFIAPRLNKELEVFEYGCGGSSLWLAQRVNNLTAVEDHPEWKKFVEKDAPPNVRLLLRPINAEEEYSKAIVSCPGQFDVVIVDGKERNSCVKYSIGKLSGKGVMIIDNSDRPDYQPAFELLKATGFKRIDFWGMCPIVSINSCTSVFYKENNCLNL